MEAVGLVASIVALIQATHAVAEGVRRVVDAHRAPEEIRVLEEQLEFFQKVLQATKAHYDGQRPSNLVTLALLNAENVMEELKQVVTVKLVRQRHPFNRLLHSNWLRYKGDVVRLCAKLKEAREILREALNLDLLISTRQMESSLTVITNSLAQRSRISSSTPNETSEIITTNRTLQVIRKTPSPATALELSPYFFPESYTDQSMPDLVCYYAREVESSEFVRTNHCALYFSRTPREWIRLTASITTNIESIFWKTWKTTDRDADCNFQLDRTGFPEAIGSSISSFFSQHPRELTQDSHLSIYLGSSHSSYGPTTGTITEMDSDTKTLPGPSTASNNMPNVLIPIAKGRTKPEAFAASVAYLRHLTRTSLRHMNCPRYHEKEIIQQPMRSPYGMRELRDKFIAFINSRWVAVSKFGSSRNLIDLALYTLQVLHCLRGRDSSGKDILAGIVLDNEGIVTSYLREMPTKGYLLLLMERGRQSGEVVSMARRESWCRQLVQSVVDVHSLQFGANPYVVGMLGEVCNGIAVDGADRAVLFDCFQPRFRLDQSRYPGLPPEDHDKYPFESFAGESESTSVVASPRTDVYQLGLLLWRIVSYRPFGFAQNNVYPFCEELECCAGDGIAYCADPTTHSVQLRLPEVDAVGEKIPDYVKDIIAACRIDNPDERPAAWELLDMFPPVDNIEQDIDECGESTEPQHLTRPEDCDRLYGGIFFCDVCGNPILTSRHFQCHVCHGSDYDICSGCFEAGGHCPEAEHVLTEYRPSESRVGTYSVRYFTSVKENGKRDLVCG